MALSGGFAVDGFNVGYWTHSGHSSRLIPSLLLGLHRVACNWRNLSLIAALGSLF
jgi:hypothetical protein